MTAFISHSFENKPEFENVADALRQRGIAYWNPAEIKPGASLREQLRAAVERCPVCIFIATRDSVSSSWCGSELGAFWGAGKPIIVYLAEPALRQQRFAAIISDMGRAEGPREGYVLLEAVRATDRDIPFFIYAGSHAPEHRREAALRGAQGTTNRPDELVEMVMRALPAAPGPHRP